MQDAGVVLLELASSFAAAPDGPGVHVLLLPILLGFLALALVTVRGLLARERTPLPALAGALATAAVLLGLVRLYLGAVEADEQNTSGEPDAATTALLLGGVGAVIALALRLRYLTTRRSR